MYSLFSCLYGTYLSLFVYLKWPLRLLTASEVTFDLGNELRDLYKLCSSAYFFSLSLKSLLFPGGGGGGNKIDL